MNLHSSLLAEATPGMTMNRPIEEADDNNITMDIISSFTKDFGDHGMDEISLSLSDYHQTPSTTPKSATPDRFLGSSISSHSSSTSTTLTPVDLLPEFEHSIEPIRKVVFSPFKNPPHVHEFDWNVEFRPNQTAGHKRQWSPTIEDIDMIVNEPNHNPADDKSFMQTTMKTSSSSLSFDQKESRRFWKGSERRKENNTGGNVPSCTQDQVRVDTFVSNSNQSRSNHNTNHLGITQSSPSARTVQNLSNNHTNTSNISTDRPGCGTSSLFRNLFPWTTSSTSLYNRPTKRNRTEAKSSHYPVHGILKNRMTSPVSVPTTETSANTGFATPNFVWKTSATPTNPQHPSRIGTLLAISSPPAQHPTRRSKQFKRMRFVDSRIKAVKCLQSGHLFSFGGDYQPLHYNQQDNDDDNEGTESFRISANTSRQSLVAVVSDDFNHKTMAEF